MQTLLMESAIRSMLIAAVIALVLFAMRIKTAAALHAVWSSVVVLMMLLPVWLAWGPKASLPVLPSATIAPLDFVSPQSPAGLAETAPHTSPVRQNGGYVLPDSVTVIYFLGFGVLLFRLAIGTIRASRLTNSSCIVPVTVGLLHPRIILPGSSREWPQAQLDAVLAHEGEHIRRRDPLFQWLALLNRALFWFHPLAWWLERKLSGLAEEACDAAVLAQGHDPRDYSEYLLDLARSVERAGTRVNALGMAMPGIGLPYRIQRMLSGVPVPRISRPRMACTLAICASAAVILAAGTLVRAQGPKFAFDVASIKPHQGRVSMIGTAISGTRVMMTAYTVSNLITDAYDLKDYQMAGVTGWVGSDRYDIIARSAGDSTPTRNQAMQMLQTLLTERFKLKFHRDTKEMAIYALVIGKNGPKLKENPIDPFMMRMHSPGAETQMTFTAAPMERLALQLGSVPGVDRPVLDKTGLTGNYDSQLNLTGQPGNPVTGLGGESVFTAIEEQLGLKLESSKAPIGILVIDHVERPSEN